MDLSIETGALTIFWGSCLANLLWTNRQAICSATKKYAEGATRFVVNKSKKILKRAKTERRECEKTCTTPQESGNLPEQTSPLNIREMKAQAQKEEGDKPEQVVEIQKKDKNKMKKRKNLRRYTKNYEQWFLKRAYLRKMEEKPTNAFKEYLKQMDERKWSDQIVISQKKEVEEMEDFEKYVEEQLDIDEEDQMNCLLPYDPFVQEPEQQE